MGSGVGPGVGPRFGAVVVVVARGAVFSGRRPVAVMAMRGRGGGCVARMGMRTFGFQH